MDKVKKLSLVGMFAAIALLGGPARSQDGKTACPVKEVAKAKYCVTCKKIVEKDGIQDGMCKLDHTPIKKVQVCVKASGNALVVYVCRGCKARSYFRDELADLTHDTGCGEKEFRGF